MVYLTRREVMVAPGRGAEFEAWWTETQQMLKSQKGFRLATLGRAGTGPWGSPDRGRAA